MIEKSFFAGFGGQGILSMGQLWVYFGMQEGKNVTFFPFYGAEKRGGIARASPGRRDYTGDGRRSLADGAFTISVAWQEHNKNIYSIIFYIYLLRDKGEGVIDVPAPLRPSGRN